MRWSIRASVSSCAGSSRQTVWRKASGSIRPGTRSLAFVIGCFFAGLAGAFYSQYLSTVSPDGFPFLFTIYIFIYVVVGGQQSFLGPILGAIVLTLLPEVTRTFKGYVPFFVAAVLIAVVFFMPNGLAGIPSRIRNAVRR